MRSPTARSSRCNACGVRSRAFHSEHEAGADPARQQHPPHTGVGGELVSLRFQGLWAYQPLPYYAPAALPLQENHEYSDDVRQLQLLLNRAGFESLCNGYFMGSTAADVRRFQQAAGLEETGIVDQETWDRLSNT